MNICQQPVGSTILTSFTLFKFSEKYKMFEKSQKTLLRCVCHSNISINWLRENPEIRGKRLQRVRNKNCSVSWSAIRAHAHHRSLRFSLSTVPYSRKIQWFTRSFLLPSRFACEPINHYYFSDVQQNIWNSLLYYSVSQRENLLLSTTLY